MTGIEIERKFLVRTEMLPPLGPGVRMTQAYLGFEPVVRVRLAGERAWLTVKGKGLLSRREVETEIPPATARELLDLRSPGTALVVKTRHRVEAGGHVWEVDLFEGEHAGLVLAEVELSSEDEAIAPPPWVGEEVTRDPRYQNSNLARAGKGK
jgi:adenylate cyclase